MFGLIFLAIALAFGGALAWFLKTDFGIGVRFHSLLATPLRVEWAKGNEGSRLVFAGSAAF